MIEKIDLNKIRGKWSVNYCQNTITPHGVDSFCTKCVSGQGDDTENSLKIIAEKVNEIVDTLQANKENK